MAYKNPEDQRRSTNSWYQRNRENIWRRPLGTKSVTGKCGSPTKARKNASIAARLTQRSSTFTTFCGKTPKRCINLRRMGRTSKQSKRPKKSASLCARIVTAFSIGMRFSRGRTRDACKRKRKQIKLAVSEVTLRHLVETSA
jgi:hypothetical protein